MNQRSKKPMRARRNKHNALARQILGAIKRQKRSALPPVALPCDTKTAVAPTVTRVFGPYPSGKRWRLLLRQGSAQHALPFDTREEAERAKAQMVSALADAGARTIGEALAEYMNFKRESGCRERTITACLGKLAYLPQTATLSGITPDKAEKLYRGQTETMSAATHHKNLRDAKAFFEFCVGQRYVASNPFKDIRPIGKANAGKPQLRRDEAKKLIDVLLRQAEDSNRSALALLVQLIMGLRSGEVLNLRKRDIDADGTILIVEGTKTKNARRLLAIAPVLRDLLARRVESLGPESLIFADDDRATPLPTDHLFKKLHKFCKLAGIPSVCPHSLRGLHSSLAVEAGATSAVVAAALGHGSDAITLKHYIAPSAIDAARSSRVSAALLDPDLDQLITTLRSLSAPQLERVLSAVGASR